MPASYINSHGQNVGGDSSVFRMIDNYIYIYHIKTLVVLPTFPDSITDATNVEYNPTPILNRSAPIYSYASSGPRSIDFTLKLHRDMLYSVNKDNTRLFPKAVDDFGSTTLKQDDYLDRLIRELQAIALPRYQLGDKLIDPPQVAVRFGDEVFIKGVVTGSVSAQYEGPILANPLYGPDGNYLYDSQGKRLVGNGKYATATISFKIEEIEPYDAETVAKEGSLRGVSTSIVRGEWGKR